MGIVQRQGIKNTLVRFGGVFIGLISMLYVYPLNDAIYGYAQFLFNTAQFLVPFMSIGIISLVVKYYPEFSKNDKAARGFIYYLILMAIVVFLLFVGVAAIFKEQLYGFLDTIKFDVSVIKENELYILLLGLILIFVALFTAHISNFGRIAIPTLLQNFLFKIFLPLIVLAFVFEKMTQIGVAKSIVLFFFFVLISLVFYAHRMKAMKFKWNPGFLTRERVKRMSNYMVFGAFNSIGGALTFKIDAIMITTLLSTTSTGIYFKILIMANIIDIPTQSLLKITGPIISRSWEDGDRANIIEIYKKSSVNLLIAGLGIFLAGWYMLDDLFAISINPDSFEGGKMIFLFLAAGKILDMMTSVNGSIIAYSKAYRFNLLFILILGISNVILNYFLIGKYDVVGCAIASCFALFIYNLIKLLFIYFKFDMQPFSIATLKLFLIAGFVFMIVGLIPNISNPYFSIIIKGLVTLILYATLVVGIKISKDLNELLFQYLRKIF